MGGAGAGEVEDSSPDWARLRAIAEGGRQRPLLGGPTLIIWGVAIAAASLVNWAVLSGVVRWPGWAVSLAWFGLTGGAALLARWSQAREGSSEEGASALSTANRVTRAVWAMGGAFLGTLAIGLVVFAVWADGRGLEEAWLLLAVMPPVVFGVYGIALAATATAGEAPWLLRYAWIAFAFTVGTAILVGRTEQLLLAAAGAVAVSVLPGLRLLRDGRGG